MVRLIHRPAMVIAVYCGRKTTTVGGALFRGIHEPSWFALVYSNKLGQLIAFDVCI